MGDAHERPAGASDETVAAVGKASEAFEFVERLRGSLYELHQLMGRADFLLRGRGRPHGRGRVAGGGDALA